MIQANELRIGNYIRIEAGGIVEVLLYHIEEICEGTLIGEGIALTEDILLKCGIDEFMSIGGMNLKYIDSKFILGYFNYQDEFIESVIVNSLHQLQNLYFALTNEELEFKN